MWNITLHLSSFIKYMFWFVYFAYFFLFCILFILFAYSIIIFPVDVQSPWSRILGNNIRFSVTLTYVYTGFVFFGLHMVQLYNMRTVTSNICYFLGYIYCSYSTNNTLTEYCVYSIHALPISFVRNALNWLYGTKCNIYICIHVVCLIISVIFTRKHLTSYKYVFNVMNTCYILRYF